MAVSGDLVVKIGGNNRGLSKALNSSRGMIGNFASSIGPMMLAAGASAGTALIAGIAAGTAAVVATGIKSVKTFTSVGDSLQKMSQRTGVSVEALSELKFASDLAGGSIETIEKGIKRMATTLLDAGNGSKEAVDSLKAIGLSVQTLKGLSPDRQFIKIGDALSKVTDASMKAALAQKIFGRAGTELLPLFVEGLRGVKGATDEARRLGLTVTKEEADAAALLGDAWTKVKAVVGSALFGLGRIITETFSIRNIGEGLAIFTAKLRNDWLPAIQGVLSTVRLAFDGVAMFIKDTWGGLFGAGGDLLQDALFFARNMDLIAKLVAAHFFLFAENTMQLFRNMGMNGIAIFQSLVTGISILFGNLFTDVLDNAKRFGKALLDAIKGRGFNFELKFDLLRGGAAEDFKKIGGLLTQGLKSSSPEIQSLLRQIAEREAARLKAKAGGADPTKPGGDALGGAVKQGPVEGAVRGTSEFFKRLSEIRQGGRDTQEKQLTVLEKVDAKLDTIARNTKPQIIEGFDV